MKKIVFTCVLVFLSTVFCRGQNLTDGYHEYGSSDLYDVPAEFLQQDFRIVHGRPWYKDGNLWCNFNLSQLNVHNGLFFQLTDPDPVCIRFVICASNHRRAYYVLKGLQRHGLVNRGEYDNGIWNWADGIPGHGADITPVEVSNPHTGVCTSAFCVDPQNENRIFLAIGSKEIPVAEEARILMSEDGGEHWTKTGSGLAGVYATHLEFQGDDPTLLIARTAKGFFYWNPELKTWIKE